MFEHDKYLLLKNALGKEWSWKYLQNDIIRDNIVDSITEFLENYKDTSKSYAFNKRKLAGELGFSLGKLNYCLKALKNKGLIKISNFKKNPHKLNYIYVLTPKGFSQKTKLTINFMKRKMKEYDELKKELDK